MKRKSITLAVAAFSVFTAVTGQAAVLISEFEPNPEGTDPATTTFEIVGTAGAPYNVTLLTIEAESNPGVIDSFITASGNFDSNGIATLTNPVDVENPAYTALLVTGFTGALSNDLDTDNDGVLDIIPWATIEDSLALPDAGSVGSGDKFYSSVVIPAGTSPHDDEPVLVFRNGTTGGWLSVHEVNGTLEYDVFSDGVIQTIAPGLRAPNALNTIGALNATIVPEPSTALLGGLGLLALLRRRR